MVNSRICVALLWPSVFFTELPVQCYSICHILFRENEVLLRLKKKTLFFAICLIVCKMDKESHLFHASTLFPTQLIPNLEASGKLF